MRAGLALLALVVMAVLAGRHGRWWAVGLAVASVIWLLADGSVEGTVIFTVSAKHGLTGADLGGLAGLAASAIILVVGRP